jgi:hypothetical protein
MVFGLTRPIWWTRVSHMVQSWKVVMTWLSTVSGSSAQRLDKRHSVCSHKDSRPSFAGNGGARRQCQDRRT